MLIMVTAQGTYKNMTFKKSIIQNMQKNKLSKESIAHLLKSESCKIHNWDNYGKCVNCGKWNIERSKSN